MNKITDIKKVSSTKHGDVDDQTKETEIDVHKEEAIHKEDKKPSKQQTKDSTSTKNRDLTKIRITFMGTGEFATIMLEEIFAKAPGTLVQIVTQPDKKLGRKKTGIQRTLAPNPVRDFATEHNIPLLQPVAFTEDVIQTFKAAKPDVVVVASYGQILKQDVLNIPEFGLINIHASLLPELRGASPIQNALLQGKTETGVTIIKMDEGVDTGPIIAQEKVKILEHEKADELLKRVGKIGAKLLLKQGPKFVRGDIKFTPQDNSKATLCQLIDREDGHIQWTDTTQEIYNRYRALHPWPGIFSYWEEKENQLLRLKFRTIYPYSKELTEEQKELLPGTVFIAHDQLSVKTFDGAIIVEAVQPECKAIMPIYDFLNGHKDFDGAVLK
jgi:methionyl-tRNA formyltransferase